MPARRPTTSCSGRSPRPARRSVAAGRAGRVRHRPLAARLEKRIPVAAGLAGGSSRRRRHGRRRAGGVGRRARRADPARGRRPSRLGRAVLPRRRARARRGPRRARRAAPRPARVAGRRPRHAASSRSPPRTCSPPSTRSAHAGDGAVRMSSAHLAEELRAGLTADNLVARAGVLASANDLLPATALVVPALVPFRRALSRLLGATDRPVRLRSDPVGALSFRRRRRPPPPTTVRAARRPTAASSRRARQAPFVGATIHRRPRRQEGTAP